jgi:magnesium chelatase accessory protein
MASAIHRTGSLDWERDGSDWPNRGASGFFRAGGLRWHVQRMGDGPVALLLHGTGASTHSWRGLVPLLARSFTIVAPDLPGHGFTQSPPFDQLSLDGMSKALAELLRVLKLAPLLAVGHSAGAAILARMSLSRQINAKTLISINGALLPIGGLAGYLFQPLAKVLVNSSILPALFARRAENPVAVEKLLRGTGSAIDAEGIDLYARLFRNPGHAAAALGMMANWDLYGLNRELPNLKARLVLVAAGNDLTIDPDQAFRVRDVVPTATVEYVRGLGHLAHEERPALIADIIERCATSCGLLQMREGVEA